MIFPPNENGICSWERWTTLTTDQQQYEIHRNLVSLNQWKNAMARVVKLYALGGGVIGGAVAVLGIFSFRITFGV